MSESELREKAINLKGNQYVLVVDRVRFFNETYPKGSISTEIADILYDETEKPLFIVKATVETGDGRTFTGQSQARQGGKGANREAALENAETSAVGRALAFMSIGVIDSIASADEMHKAGVYPKPPSEDDEFNLE